MSLHLLPRIALLALLAGACLSAQAQGIPEEAQRRMIRGQTAVEMARTPEDYELAIREFREAARQAPNWADPHYNLGLVQEKNGHYKDAVASFREYLRLAPKASDAAAVRSQLYRLEMKAEQEVTDEDALSIFASLLDTQRWKVVPASPTDDVTVHRHLSTIRIDGGELVIDYRSRHDRVRSLRVRSAGKQLEFMYVYNLCEASVQRDECPVVYRYKLEVVSRHKVRARVKVFTPAIAQVKASSTDHSLEFVARDNP